MKQIIVNTLEEFKHKVESKDLDTTQAIYEAIRRGVTKKYKTVNVFDVQLKQDPLNVYKFKLDKNQWSFALNSCMDVFSKHDMFEECIEIQKLLKELEKVAA